MENKFTVAFWSPWHGRGNTANAISISLAFAMKYNVKSLLTHSQYAHSAMEQAFISDDADSTDVLKFSDTGIDALERLSKIGYSSSEEISNYCTNIIHDRLDLLTGSKKSSKALFSDSIGKTILDIFRMANSQYDFTFIDLNSGLKDEISLNLIKKADLVVVTLDQSDKVLKEFFTNDINVLKNKNTIVCIGKYDEKSKCSKKYVKSMFNFEGNIFCVPYETKLLDAFNNHKVLEYFMINNKNLNGTYEDVFFNEVNMIVDEIVNILNVGLEKEELKKDSLKNKVAKLLKLA